MKQNVGFIVVLAVLMVLLTGILFLLFGYYPQPVVVQSPAPVTVNGDTLYITLHYTRTINTPTTVYASFERTEDGLLVFVAPEETPGLLKGENVTTSIGVPLPCLPPGEWIRNVRTEYDLLGNGWLVRHEEYHTMPFVVSEELSAEICSKFAGDL